MTATALAYRGLLDIDEVQPLSSEDRPCLDEIREVLKKYGRLNRFGVTLLHQHFPIAENEVLVETCDSEVRELRMIVQPREILIDGRLVETSWRLRDDAALLGCYNACVAAGGSHKRKHVER